MSFKKLLYTIITYFIYLGSLSASDDLCSFLTAPEEHAGFIRTALNKATERVIIVSPFITEWRLTDSHFNGYSGLGGPIKRAIERGVEVSVFTDSKFDSNKSYAAKGRQLLAALGVDLKIVSRLHAKNLIIDSDCITIGSFNWLSADTNPSGKFCNYENTSVLRDERAYPAIKRILPQLLSLVVVEHGGSYSFSLLDFSLDEDDQIAYAIKLYREHRAQPHYKMLAEHVLANSITYNCEPDQSLKILRLLQSDEESLDLVLSMVDAVLVQCSRASDYIELAELLVSKKQRKKAIEIASLILQTDRAEEYDNLDYLYKRLRCLGMSDIGDKFEMYILVGTTE